MSQFVLRLCTVLGLSAMLGVAHAQSADEVLEPGAQELPPVEGSEAGDGPAPPSAPKPTEPPQTPGPSGALGEGPTGETNGLIALLRADPPISGPVHVVLSGGGAEAKLALNDSGEAPDVTAGDGIWAGLAEEAPLSGTVVVEVAGKKHNGGQVSWSPEEKPRELKVRLLGNTVEVSATSHTSSTSTPPASVNGKPAVKASPGPSPSAAPAAGPSTADAAAPAPVAAAPAAGGGLDWLGGLALVVALAALGVAFLRKPAPPAPAPVPAPAPHKPPPLPTRVAEAGILGSGTPSLSGGVSVFTGPDALLGPLLSTLGRQRPVVVATAPGRALPPVHGAAVFQVQSLVPSALADALRAVQASGGLAVCVVVLPDGPATGALVASVAGALPAGTGAVVFAASSDSDGPTVALEPAPGGVAVSVGGRALRRVAVGPRGFQLD